MRIRRAKIIAEIGFALIGTVLLFIAIFAYQLHVDKNQLWGPSRIAIAIIGFFFQILAYILVSSSIFIRFFKLPIFQKARSFINIMRAPYLWLIEPDQEKPESIPSHHRTGWFVIFGATIAIFVSWWYITSGRMVSWTPSSTYFDRQANAFLAGQLSLLEQAPTELAALENPYDYHSRVSIGEYLWDSTYYNGKYYYYWGPVPGLMAATAKLIKPDWLVQDQFLIIFSIFGLAIVLAGFFYRLQKNFFPKIPGWLVLGFILLGVLNTPVFWLVNAPDVHEVPIATGQLFQILGLFTALMGMESKKHQSLLLSLTGFFWGAAVCSRLDLVIGIAWMTFLICLFLLLKSRNWKLSLSPIIALIFPLALWAGGLSWYNFSRFGNILETGHRYQLTGGAMPEDYRNIVSISYILPNLYNLLARPMEIYWREFPFFFTPFIRDSSWPKYLFYPRNPNYYFDEPITGIFLSIPALWLILIPSMVIPFRRFWNWLRESPAQVLIIKDLPLSTWFGWMVAGALILDLGILSIFIYSTMRYEADLTPLLTILIALCVGWVSTIFHNRPRLWKSFLFLVGTLILISIMISLFSSLQNSNWMFANSNPLLYQAIAHFFTGK